MMAMMMMTLCSDGVIAILDTITSTTTCRNINSNMRHVGYYVCIYVCE